MSQFQAFRNHAVSNLMDIEYVLEDVYSVAARGLNGFVCFDGGAHRGFHTSRLSLLPGCKAVIAAEADPIMIGHLNNSLNAALPNLDKIVIVQAALQRDPNLTSIPWQSSSSHDGRSSILSANQDQPTIWSKNEGIEYREQMSVPATTIDKLMQSYVEPMPFMKLDLEGADLMALFGARNTLLGKRPIVAFENSSEAPGVHGFTLDEVIGYMHGVGYVPMDFGGTPLTKDSWFNMWEAWAAPIERADWLSEQLKAVLTSRGF